MIAWLWAWAALAGPVADLAAAVPGVPIVAVSCDRASRIVGTQSGGFGLGVVGQMPADEADRVFEQPLRMVMASTDEALALVIEGGSSDPERLAERLADPTFAERLPPGAIVSAHGDRLRILLPQGEAVPGTKVAVVDRVDGEPAPGCAIAVDVGALLGDSAPFPMADRVTLAVARMESPRGEHRITLEVTPLPTSLVAVIDGQGGDAFDGVSSTVVFDTVYQVHGGIEEIAKALPSVSEGPLTAAAAGLADDLGGRITGRPGALVALGGPESGGAIVVPFERPRAKGRLRTLVRRLAAGMGAEVSRLDGGLVALTFFGRPAVTAGTARGLAVVAFREDVVRDVLAGSGTPWLPAPGGPYGLRVRSDHGVLGGAFRGYLELRYDGEAIQVLALSASEE